MAEAPTLQRLNITSIGSLIQAELNQDLQTTAIQEYTDETGTTVTVTVPDRIKQIVKEAYEQIWNYAYYSWRRRHGTVSVSGGTGKLPDDFEVIDSKWAHDVTRTQKDACIYTNNPTYYDAVYADHYDDETTDPFKCALIEPQAISESVTTLCWQVRTAPANSGTLRIVYFAICPAIADDGTAIWPVAFDTLWHWLALANCQAQFRQEAWQATYAKFKSEIDRRVAADAAMSPNMDGVIADAYGDLITPNTRYGGERYAGLKIWIQ